MRESLNTYKVLDIPTDNKIEAYICSVLLELSNNEEKFFKCFTELFVNFNWIEASQVLVEIKSLEPNKFPQVLRNVIARNTVNLSKITLEKYEYIFEKDGLYYPLINVEKLPGYFERFLNTDNNSAFLRVHKTHAKKNLYNLPYLGIVQNGIADLFQLIKQLPEEYLQIDDRITRSLLRNSFEKHARLLDEDFNGLTALPGVIKKIEIVQGETHGQVFARDYTNSLNKAIDALSVNNYQKAAKQLDREFNRDVGRRGTRAFFLSWYNFALAHFLRGICAEKMGERELALEQYTLAYSDAKKNHNNKDLIFLAQLYKLNLMKSFAYQNEDRFIADLDCFISNNQIAMYHLLQEFTQNLKNIENLLNQEHLSTNDINKLNNFILCDQWIFWRNLSTKEIKTLEILTITLQGFVLNFLIESDYINLENTRKIIETQRFLENCIGQRNYHVRINNIDLLCSVVFSKFKLALQLIDEFCHEFEIDVHAAQKEQIENFIYEFYAYWLNQSQSNNKIDLINHSGNQIEVPEIVQQDIDFSRIVLRNLNRKFKLECFSIDEFLKKVCKNPVYNNRILELLASIETNYKPERILYIKVAAMVLSSQRVTTYIPLDIFNQYNQRDLQFLKIFFLPVYQKNNLLTFRLTGFPLDQYHDYELSQIFASIPTGVQCLDLSNCNYKSSKTIFSVLPESISTIDLSNTTLEDFEKLHNNSAAIISSLNNCTYKDGLFEFHDLSGLISACKKIQPFYKFLPASINTIILNDENYDISGLKFSNSIQKDIKIIDTTVNNTEHEPLFFAIKLLKLFTVDDLKILINKLYNLNSDVLNDFKNFTISSSDDIDLQVMLNVSINNSCENYFAFANIIKCVFDEFLKTGFNQRFLHNHQDHLAEIIVYRNHLINVLIKNFNEAKVDISRFASKQLQESKSAEIEYLSQDKVENLFNLIVCHYLENALHKDANVKSYIQQPYEHNKKNLNEDELQSALQQYFSIPLPNLKEYFIDILHFALQHEKQYPHVLTYFLMNGSVIKWLSDANTKWANNPDDIKNNEFQRLLINKVMLIRLADPTNTDYQPVSLNSHIDVPSQQDRIPTADPNKLSENLQTNKESLQKLKRTLNTAQIAIKKYDEGQGLTDSEVLDICETLNNHNDIETDIVESIQTILIQKHTHYLDTLTIDTNENARHESELHDDHEDEETKIEETQIESKAVELEDESTDASKTKHNLSLTTTIHDITKLANAFSTDKINLKHNEYFSTLKIILSGYKLINPAQVKLLQELIHSLCQLVENGLEANELHHFLFKFLSFLDSTKINAAKNFGQAYIRPLMHIVNESSTPLDDYALLPLPAVKIEAIKSIYQILNKVDFNQFNAQTTYDAGRILYSLLVLAGQDQLLIDWIYGLLQGKNIFATNVNQLYSYYQNAKTWRNHLTHLDKLLDQATIISHSEQTTEKIYLVVEEILRLHDVTIESDDYSQVIENILNSDIDSKSGLMRFHPLLIVASEYCSNKDHISKAKLLYSEACAIKFITELTNVRDVTQLFVVFNDFEDVALSGHLGSITQVLGLGLLIRNAHEQYLASEDPHKNLFSIIDNININKLRYLKDTELGNYISNLLEITHVVKHSYNLFTYESVHPIDLITSLKAKEKIYKFAPEYLTYLRMIVSAKYLGSIKKDITFNGLITDIIAPISMIWEQHELTASIVLIPNLAEAVKKVIYEPPIEHKLEFYINQINTAFKNSIDLYSEYEKKNLFNPSNSTVYSLVRNGKLYLDTADKFIIVCDALKHIPKLNFLNKATQRFANLFIEHQEVKKSIHSATKFLTNGMQTPEFPMVNTNNIKHMSSGFGKVLVSTAFLTIADVMAPIAAVASVINIGVSIYYGQKTLQKLNEMQDEIRVIKAEMTVYHQEVMQNLTMINTKLDSLDRKLDLEFQLLNASISLEVNHLTYVMNSSVKHILDNQEELKKAINARADEIISLIKISQIENYLRDFNTTHDELKTNLKVFDIAIPKRVKKLFLRFYSRMNGTEAGLLSDCLMGLGLVKSQAQSLLFLNQMFCDVKLRLPNLIYWIEGCDFINNYIYQLSKLNLSNQGEDTRKILKSYTALHVNLIKNTFEILKALSLISTKEITLEIVQNLKKALNNSDLQQQLHQIAVLCGIPLHQFGEDNDLLWSDVEYPLIGTNRAKIVTPELTEEQIHKKERLQLVILDELQKILNSDSFNICSVHILLVQDLLLKLMISGINFFDNFEEMIVRECHAEPLLISFIDNPSRFFHQRLLTNDITTIDEIQLNEISLTRDI